MAAFSCFYWEHPLNYGVMPRTTFIIKNCVFLDDVSCSDLRTVRNITVAATFVYFVLEITAFIGMIFGCVGVCCSSKVCVRKLAYSKNYVKACYQWAHDVVKTLQFG